MSESQASSLPPRVPHPSAFLFLLLPFGASLGFLTVTVGYLARRADLPLSETAFVVATGLLPHTWKFLLAPVVDASLTRKRWYLIASLLNAAGLLAIGLAPITRTSAWSLSATAFVWNIGVALQGMSVEGLMAYSTSARQRGAASGWLQAGNLGGTGLGGGLGLLLAEHWGAATSAMTMAGLLLCCNFALGAVADTPARHNVRIGDGIRELRAEWSLLRNRDGFWICVLLCILPIGKGAASNLWASLAVDWGASPEVVAVATGVLSGVVSAFGCVVGGKISDGTHRQNAYVVFGLLLSLVAAGMAVTPRTPAAYALFVAAYAFPTGLAYAAFTGLVMNLIGNGAVATKYNTFAALVNMAIYYATRVDGWAHGKWGATGMLWLECSFGVLSAVVFAVASEVARRRVAIDVE